MKIFQNLRGTRKSQGDEKGSKASDYSHWYESHVLEMEGKVKAKLDQYYKPSLKVIFSQSCTFQHKEVGLISASKIQGWIKKKKKQAGNEYNEDALKPRFGESTEAVCRPKCDAPESNNVSTKVDQSVTKQQPSLLQTKQLAWSACNEYPVSYHNLQLRGEARKP